VGYRDAPEGAWRGFVLGTDLTGGPVRTAKLAVVRADGSPHVAPVWVDLDGDEVVFTTGRSTIKGKAILRDGRVALCWDDERPPFSFVTVSGPTTVVHDREQVRYWAGRIGGRYMGADRAAEYAARNGVPDELIVRVRPDKIVMKVAVAD
jgi:PPOX class probable F420-dependent enzyme